MKYALTLAVTTFLTAPHAFALDSCKAGEDASDRICIYQQSQRYSIKQIVGYPVNIAFGSDEHVWRFAPAYTGVTKNDKGEVSPSPTWAGPKCKNEQGQEAKCAKDEFKNNITIWPFFRGRSAAVIITHSSADGNTIERAYSFDLTAIPPAENCDDPPKPPAQVASTGPVSTPEHKPPEGCPENNELTSAITFSYPVEEAASKKKEAEDKRQAAVAAWQQRQAVKKEQEAKDRLRLDPVYCPRPNGCNKSYDAQGDKRYAYLAPKLVWDNGSLTTMVWPANVTVPMVSVIDPVTNEPHVAPIYSSNLATQVGQMVTFTGTSQRWRLSMGKTADGRNPVLDVLDMGWNPNKPDYGTGTSSPDVVETVIQAKKQ